MAQNMPKRFIGVVHFIEIVIKMKSFVKLDQKPFINNEHKNIQIF